ncbi:hypothetical protein [Arthrobacter sp. SPG23]|uniref:hypothetical protein n=1 Tax=Arthrobacter sp. SPG23 TaxID=1610703 RepID=UPI000A60D667|nr:hypothetical protein [Arthrobacter sp. SPG23]
MESHSWDYDQWQSELDRVLLRGRNNTDPVVVFVSREMLEENFPFFEAPLDSLARAVLNAMRPDSPSKAFAPIRQRLTVWEKSSRSLVPPILPLVALTVAAAADMGADERGGPLMYYGRLQEILGEPITAQQLSNSFEDVAWMWRTLSQWITEQQWLGPSTILEDTHLSRIGFARSQAVISKQDAANLRDFFFSIGRGKLDDLTPRQLLSELMRWNRKFKRLSRVLTRSLEGDQTGPEMKLLASVMPLLARKWDGQPKEHQSQAQLRVQIRLDLDAWTARWVVPRRQGIDALDVVDASGRELSLRSVGVGGFYRSTGLPDSVASSIDSSHKWSTADVRIQMKPRKVWMFAVDAVSGDWVSTNVLEPFDEIALLIREDQTEDFCGILDAVGVQGYKRIGGSRQIVNGWDLFLRVNLSDNADDTRIIEWLGYGRASVEESAESPRLVNGLRVRSHSGVEVYVAGGEPDLVVPATPFGTYSISLDGSDEMELRANGSALPLHKLVTPDPASHFLFINDSHILEFETIAVDDPNLVPANNLMEPVTGRNLVSVDTGRERIVLARSADHWTVTRHGTITKIVAPKIPEWLSNAGYTNEYRFDAEVPADAVWLVTVRRDAIRSIKKLGTADVELNLDGMGASEAEWKFLSRDEGLVQRGADWLNVVYQARRLLRF